MYLCMYKKIYKYRNIINFNDYFDDADSVYVRCCVLKKMLQ